MDPSAQDVDEAEARGDRIPDGTLEQLGARIERERVRRAAIGMAMLRRYAPDAVASPVTVRV